MRWWPNKGGLDQSASYEELLAATGMFCVWRQQEATVRLKTTMAAPKEVSIDVFFNGNDVFAPLPAGFGESSYGSVI